MKKDKQFDLIFNSDSKQFVLSGNSMIIDQIQRNMRKGLENYIGSKYNITKSISGRFTMSGGVGANNQINNCNDLKFYTAWQPMKPQNILKNIEDKMIKNIENEIDNDVIKNMQLIQNPDYIILKHSVVSDELNETIKNMVAALDKEDYIILKRTIMADEPKRRRFPIVDRAVQKARQEIMSQEDANVFAALDKNYMLLKHTVVADEPKQWVDDDEPPFTVKAQNVKTTVCSKCHKDSPYAEPNQEFICWACKNGF
jgi:hypothetical protein